MTNGKNERFFRTIKTVFTRNNSYSYQLDDPQKTTFYIGLLILISLLFKLALLTVLYHSSINNDGRLYITAARYYAEGDFGTGLSLYPMPLYPLLLALVHFLVPDWILCGHIISITSMVLATIPLYYLTKNLFGMRSAFWACLIFAFLPHLNKWSLYVSRDALFLLLFGSCLCFCFRSIKEKGLFAFGLTFISAWLSVLIRIEGVVFIFFYFCMLLLFSVIKKEQSTQFLLRSLIWAGIPVCVAIIAFLAVGKQGMTVHRIDQITAELTNFLNGSFSASYFQIYDFLAQADGQPPFSAWKYNFAALARHYILVIYLFAIFEALAKILFPLSFIPLYIGLRNKITSSGAWLLSLGLVFILLVYYSLFVRDFISTRFLLIPAFLLLPWVGLGFEVLLNRIHTTANKKMLICLIFVLLISPAIKTMALVSRNDNTITLAAEWLTEHHLKKNTKIATNNEEVPFYIDLELNKRPDEPSFVYHRLKNNLKIERFALRKNAGFIILKFKNKKTNDLPQFKYFKKIKSFGGRKYTTHIYKKINGI